MSKGLLHKLRWRVDYLLGDNPFALRERLAYINPIGESLTEEELISRSLRRGTDGDDYFQLDGLKLYFRPDFPVGDEAEFLSCIQLVLRESYLYHDLLAAGQRRARRLRPGPGRQHRHQRHHTGPAGGRGRAGVHLRAAHARPCCSGTSTRTEPNA